MDISLDLVVEAVQRRVAALTPEVAGYVVLLAARRLQPRPSRVTPEAVFLSEGGEVNVRSEPAASELEVEVALRGLLANLLELSPSFAPAISDVAQACPSGSLQAFTVELSAALIPINHAAAHRAIARLFRETLRARGFVLDPPPSPASPDAAPSPLVEISTVLGPDDAGATLAVRTAKPTALAQVAISETPDALDIDVELESHEALAFELERPASSLASAPRSELHELLSHFLSESRSEEQMTRTLRAMLHLEGCGSPVQIGSLDALGGAGSPHGEAQ